MNNNVGAHSGGRLRITPTGTVRRLEYMGGHPLLAESALKAVENWRYDSGQRSSRNS